MHGNSHDPVISLAEAAVKMGVKERRVRNILLRHGVHPVPTRDGVGYRLADVVEVKRFRQ